MIEIKNLKINYDKIPIIKNLSLIIKKKEIVSIIGPNGCGKSTLLKSIAKLINPISGYILIDGSPLSLFSEKSLSKTLAILSQHNTSPEDITVKQLVTYGRSPHKNWFEQYSKKDYEVISWAILHTNISSIQEKKLSNLSGGERQRVWIAMCLCQKPDILLLDEPTTYLDIGHQLELLTLIRELNKRIGITIIMVLHDINQAARFSNHIVMMKDGDIIADDTPDKTITKENIKNLYNIECHISKDPISNSKYVYPLDLSI